ncbi:MAG: hypothetical protein CMI54_00760 [Parcubacteria group bacterium]|nr:hypothetical protein [Parcubacteria group bacterium]
MKEKARLSLGSQYVSINIKYSWRMVDVYIFHPLRLAYTIKRVLGGWALLWALVWVGWVGAKRGRGAGTGWVGGSVDGGGR